MAQEQDEKFVGLLTGLNYRHKMLFEKLSEAESRLTNVALGLGGDFLIRGNKDFPHGDFSNLDNYSILLDRTEEKLTKIFDTIRRLEYLCK